MRIHWKPGPIIKPGSKTQHYRGPRTSSAVHLAHKRQLAARRPYTLIGDSAVGLYTPLTDSWIERHDLSGRSTPSHPLFQRSGTRMCGSSQGSNKSGGSGHVTRHDRMSVPKRPTGFIAIRSPPATTASSTRGRYETPPIRRHRIAKVRRG